MNQTLAKILILCAAPYASLAMAEVSATITAASEYDFRGVSQSARDPAIQASVDYAHEQSGWYVGAWASNVKFVTLEDPTKKARVETDFYTGFNGETEKGVSWDAGAIYYTYDRSVFNFPEVYAGVGYGYFKAKLFYTNDWTGKDSPGKAGAFYLTTDAKFPLATAEGLAITAHIGRVMGGDTYAQYATYGDYTDGSIGLAYSLKKFDLGLKVMATDADPKVTSRELNMETRLILTVATTLPW